MHAIQENHTILKYIGYCKSENKQGVQIPHRWHMRLNFSLVNWSREATIGNLQPNPPTISGQRKLVAQKELSK